MARFTATHLDDVDPEGRYGVARDVTGVRTSRRLTPESYPLWLVVSELEDGAVLRWDGAHGDEAVFVIDGALEVHETDDYEAADGRMCPADGAVVVESGVACTARAVGPTTVAHYGPTDPTPPGDGLYGPPQAGGHHVHVVGEGGWFRSGTRERVDARWFADSTCPTCRIAVFHVRYPLPDVADIPHHHTQDEVIYVLRGEVRMGARRYAAGTALAIPGHLRYSVTSGPEGWDFLNYRRDASVQHYARDKQPELEGGLARGGVEVADFR